MGLVAVVFLSLGWSRHILLVFKKYLSFLLKTPCFTHSLLKSGIIDGSWTSFWPRAWAFSAGLWRSMIHHRVTWEYKSTSESPSAQPAEHTIEANLKEVGIQQQWMEWGWESFRIIQFKQLLVTVARSLGRRQRYSQNLPQWNPHMQYHFNSQSPHVNTFTYHIHHSTHTHMQQAGHSHTYITYTI